MLGLQTSNLEQQERLFRNQIKLGLRQILQQELDFYNSAFNNISSCASILAGFAFTGLMLDPFDDKNDLQPKWLEHDPELSLSIEMAYNVMCAMTTCLCLLTVVYSNYLGLFATRLALRGGNDAVEESVVRIRREYKVVLHSLTASVECFIATLPVLAFYKMEISSAVVVALVSCPSLGIVLYLYSRSRKMFYLDKGNRFAAAENQADRGRFINLGDGWGGMGGRDSINVSGSVNGRDSLSAGLGSDPRSSVGRASVGNMGAKQRLRRSVSFDNAAAYGMRASVGDATPQLPLEKTKFLGSKKLGSLFGGSSKS